MSGYKLLILCISMISACSQGPSGASSQIVENNKTNKTNDTIPKIMRDTNTQRFLQQVFLKTYGWVNTRECMNNRHFNIVSQFAFR
jgi:hypothetical protein